MSEPRILVVGAGPVGLTMAAELARHGVPCRIVERRAEPSPYCRAVGVTPRTVELWDDMGIARSMIEAGLWLDGMRSIVNGKPAGDRILDLHDLPYGQLMLPQYDTERLLARHLAGFGVAVERGVAFAGLEQDGGGVSVALDGGGGRETARFDYVVGCDGAHSAVRGALGIDFEGDAMPMEFMLGDVRIDWDLPRGMALRAVVPRADAAPDLFVAIPLPEPGRYRVSMLAPPELAAPAGGTDHGIQSSRPVPGLRLLQDVADRLLEDAPRLTDLRWSSVFRISMKLAARYAERRVFIAGDAAHIHPPTGGQGMNTGIQDAYNLAWKLGLVARGAAGPALLASYAAERRPVGEDTIARTVAASLDFGRERKPPDRLAETQVRLSYRGGDWVTEALPEAPGPRAGDRAPDCGGLRQRHVGFPLRLFDVLRGTRHVLLFPGGEDLSALDRLLEAVPQPFGCLLRVAIVTPAGLAVPEPWPAQVLSDTQGGFAVTYAAEVAYLVRPDGYIGWRGAPRDVASFAAHLGKLLGSR